MYQLAQNLCPTASANVSPAIRLQATQWYINAWRSSDNTNANYPAYAAALLVSLGRLVEAKEAVDAALAIDPLNAEACAVHVSLVSQAPDNLLDPLQVHNAQILALQTMAHTESAKRDSLFGPCLDYTNEYEESKVANEGGESNFKVGALVMIGNGVPLFEGRIVLVSKSMLDGRVTIQLLEPVLTITTEGTTTEGTVTDGGYSTAMQSLRTQLSQNVDLNSFRSTDVHNQPNQFKAKPSTARIQPQHLTVVCNYCYHTPSSTDPLKKCSRCKMASYCTGECKWWWLCVCCFFKTF